jgi:hypothetical protein
MLELLAGFSGFYYSYLLFFVLSISIKLLPVSPKKPLADVFRNVNYKCSVATGLQTIF